LVVETAMMGGARQNASSSSTEEGEKNLREEKRLTTLSKKGGIKPGAPRKRSKSDLKRVRFLEGPEDDAGG